MSDINLSLSRNRKHILSTGLVAFLIVSSVGVNALAVTILRTRTDQLDHNVDKSAFFTTRVDGGAFEATDESGQALFGKAGTIVGSSLEGSNTDIADEFTKLIVTQQAYSANTKVITTSNTMVQDLLNVLR